MLTYVHVPAMELREPYARHSSYSNSNQQAVSPKQFSEIMLVPAFQSTEQSNKTIHGHKSFVISPARMVDRTYPGPETT